MRRIFFLLFTCLCLAQVSAEIHPPQSEKTPDKSGVTSKVTFSPDLYSLEFIQQEDGSFKPSTENVTITFERKDPGTFCTKIKEVSASVWGHGQKRNNTVVKGQQYKQTNNKEPGNPFNTGSHSMFSTCRQMRIKIQNEKGDDDSYCRLQVTRHDIHHSSFVWSLDSPTASNRLSILLLASSYDLTTWT
jgi:hypothetical protein